MGEYLHGMWLSALEQDIAWISHPTNVSQSRPRDGPIWSWVYVPDAPIEWHTLFFVGDYHTVEQYLNNERALSIFGTLLPVSIQTYEERERFEQHFPRARYGNVIRH
jgi:hypothetical protein